MMTVRYDEGGRRASSGLTAKRPHGSTHCARIGEAVTFGHHGEFIQGPIEHEGKIHTALVTLKDRRWASTAHGEFSRQVRTEIETRPHKPKAAAGIQILADRMATGGIKAVIDFTTSIPESRGLGSSTADIVTALRCVDMAFNLSLTDEYIANICFQVEGATDSIMFQDPASVLFASRQSKILEIFPGSLPQFDLISLDLSPHMGAIDTRDVNFDYSGHHVEKFTKIVDLYGGALKTGDISMLKTASSRSADLNQEFLPVPAWEDLKSLAAKYQLGIQLAHTGSIVGLIGDPRQRHFLQEARDEANKIYTRTIKTAIVTNMWWEK